MPSPCSSPSSSSSFQDSFTKEIPPYAPLNSLQRPRRRRRHCSAPETSSLSRRVSEDWLVDCEGSDPSCSDRKEHEQDLFSDHSDIFERARLVQCKSNSNLCNELEKKIKLPPSVPLGRCSSEPAAKHKAETERPPKRTSLLSLSGSTSFRRHRSTSANYYKGSRKIRRSTSISSASSLLQAALENSRNKAVLSERRSGKVHALLVGVNQYCDPEIEDLSRAVPDVLSAKTLLLDGSNRGVVKCLCTAESSLSSSEKRWHSNVAATHRFWKRLYIFFWNSQYQRILWTLAFVVLFCDKLISEYFYVESKKEENSAILLQRYILTFRDSFSLLVAIPWTIRFVQCIAKYFLDRARHRWSGSRTKCRSLPTKENIFSGIRDLTRSTEPGDLVIVWLACHATERAGDVVFMVADSLQNRTSIESNLIDTSYNKNDREWRNVIAYSELYGRIVQSSKATSFLFVLDVCHSFSFSSLRMDQLLKERNKKKTIAHLYACSSNETVYDEKGLLHVLKDSLRMAENDAAKRSVSDRISFKNDLQHAISEYNIPICGRWKISADIPNSLKKKLANTLIHIKGLSEERMKYYGTNDVRLDVSLRRIGGAENERNTKTKGFGWRLLIMGLPRWFHPARKQVESLFDSEKNCKLLEYKGTCLRGRNSNNRHCEGENHIKMQPSGSGSNEQQRSRTTSNESYQSYLSSPSSSSSIVSPDLTPSSPALASASASRENNLNMKMVDRRNPLYAMIDAFINPLPPPLQLPRRVGSNAKFLVHPDDDNFYNDDCEKNENIDEGKVKSHPYATIWGSDDILFCPLPDLEPKEKERISEEERKISEGRENSERKMVPKKLSKRFSLELDSWSPSFQRRSSWKDVAIGMMNIMADDMSITSEDSEASFDSYFENETMLNDSLPSLVPNSE
eukprot:g5161.t1